MSNCTHTSSEISLESLASAPGWGDRLKGVLTAIFVTLLDAQKRARERQQLASMDERTLRDMGITRADVACEIDKWFWQE